VFENNPNAAKNSNNKILKIMKKNLFFFAMLISVAASAQRTTPVTITNIKVDYSTKVVTFDLSWKGSDATHRDEVWVFVDIRPVTGVNTLGTWSPATLAPSATTVTAGSGNQYSSLTHTAVSGNTRGVWVKGTSSVTTNTFNATVKVTLAAATPDRFNACAYATDYPPNIASVSSGTYTLKGTQSFKLNGTTISGNKYAGSITSLTDPTGCPGCIAIRDFQISSSVTIPCCPNLTAIGGYCRDLPADDAVHLASCGYDLEVKKQLINVANFSVTNLGCQAGWRPATYNEIKCIHNNMNNYADIWANGYIYIVTTETATAGWNHSYNSCCDTRPSHVTYLPIHSDWCNAGDGRPNTCNYIDGNGMHYQMADDACYASIASVGCVVLVSQCVR
jgi:hypothetical protein